MSRPTSPLAVLAPADDECFHGEHCPHEQRPGPIRDAIHAAALRITVAAINQIGRSIDKHQETK